MSARPVRTLLAAAAIAAAGPTAGSAHASSDLIFADGLESSCGLLSYSENFAFADGSVWPAPWTTAGNVALSDVQGGLARLRPGATTYSLARMKAAVPSRDVELRFLFRMEDASTQGVGFYVRQNGGYLTQTTALGQGYAVFIEGPFRGLPGIGVWKEQDGVESQLAHSPGTLAGPVNGINYRVRLQVYQLNPTTTQLQAKFWQDGTSEPLSWQVGMSDTTTVLQNISGGLAVDSWSVRTAPPISANTFVDEIQVETLCVP